MAKHFRTLIIGAGFGGLCMGAQLKKRRDNDFLILEKADDIGGTWRDNTYPGAECDVPSALYSYSFFRNPTWDFKWAKQPQILKYINQVTDAFGLEWHLKLGAEVKRAVFDGGGWIVHLGSGEVLTCQFLVSAIGQLHHPNTPKFSGLKSFKKPKFHSAQWDHSFDWHGKDIAVIGNAASAVQLIPELAEKAAQLTVYHRSANWVLAKKDRPYTKIEKLIGKLFPPFTNLYRFHIWCLGEYGLWPMIKGNKLATRIGTLWFRHHLEKHIQDETLREVVTPDYPIGAKRILLSDKYFPALARDNVTVVSGGVKNFTSEGILAPDGQERAHDAVIFATGFHTNPFLKEIEVEGRDNASLGDNWAKGAFAYCGTITSGFPNLFILYGPNTNTGHTSVIFKLEQQVGYILKLMKKADQGMIDVKPEAETAYNEELQTQLSKLAWAKIDVSWYKDGDRITNNWPGSSLEFKRRLKTPIWDDFVISE